MAELNEYELAGIETIARGICIRDGKLLLCRAKGGHSTYLPGGHIEFGETGREALVREMREETGLSSRAGRFRGCVENKFLQHGKEHAEINLVYELEIDPQAEVRAQESWIEFLWCPLEDLAAANLLPAVFTALADDPACVFNCPHQDAPPRRKVFVSGCYDMMHSGHVAFFEEASRYGDLYVGLGNDENILQLKNRRTVNSNEERLYMVRSVRYVKDAWVNSGMGKMDFVKEVEALKPDIFFVNHDGYSEEKAAFCKAHGIELVVSERLPSPGLPERSTTAIRQMLAAKGKEA